MRVDVAHVERYNTDSGSLALHALDPGQDGSQAFRGFRPLTTGRQRTSGDNHDTAGPLLYEEVTRGKTENAEATSDDIGASCLLVNPNNSKNGLEPFTIHVEVFKDTVIFCCVETETKKFVQPCESIGYGYGYIKEPKMEKLGTESDVLVSMI